MRQIFHCTERHECGPDKRREYAWKSWDALYAQGVVAVHVSEYPRNATSIGDTRALPFLRDVLTEGLAKADATDIIFFTNDDIVLHHSLPHILDFHVSLYGPCSSQRCEIRRSQMPAYDAPPVEVMRHAQRHMGRDLFAATAAWWTQYWDQIGDPILGASMWDLHLACVVRKYYGIESNRKNLEQHIFPAEIPLGHISHQYHAPAWRVLHKAPSELWNRRNFQTWAVQYLPGLKFWPNGAI